MSLLSRAAGAAAGSAAGGAAARLRVLAAVAAVTYKEWAAYRSHMLLSLFIGPAFFLAQVFVWRAVYAGRSVVAGLTLDQMLMYFGTMTVISSLIMDFADWNLSMLVSTGRFLTFALRPVRHMFFALSQKVGHRSLGFVFEVLPLWLIFTFVFRIRLLPVAAGWAFASIALGFLMMFLVNYSVGILSFWLTRTEGVRALFRLFRDVMAGAFLPLSLFPLAIQKVMFFLPFQFISYVPVRVFLGRYELAGMSPEIPVIVGAQALAVIAMWMISALLFRLGVRRYTGVGA